MQVAAVAADPEATPCARDDVSDARYVHVSQLHTWPSEFLAGV